MKIAILGTGVMGCGWITQCALSGHAVHAYDADPKSLEAVARRCEKLAEKTVRKFKMNDTDVIRSIINNITTHSKKQDLFMPPEIAIFFLKLFSRR